MERLREEVREALLDADLDIKECKRTVNDLEGDLARRESRLEADEDRQRSGVRVTRLPLEIVK
jgi:hypothetical protein